MFYLYAFLGICLLVFVIGVLTTPKLDMKKYTKVSQLPTWSDLVHIFIFGGCFKKLSADWKKLTDNITTDMTFTVEQADVDEYNKGLLLKGEERMAKLPEGVVPVGLLATLVPRLSYVALLEICDFHHFHCLGLVNTKMGFESLRPLKVGTKLNAKAKAKLDYVKRGLDIVAFGTISDEQGEAFKFSIHFLKMMKHGKKIESSSKRKDFSDATSVKEEQWTVSSSQPGKWLGISGDPNPIHMHPLLGKLFGQKSNIMHGTWLFSKAFSYYEPEMAQGPYKGELKFIAPLNLPGKGTLKVYKGENENTREVTIWVKGRGGQRVGSLGTLVKM